MQSAAYLTIQQFNDHLLHLEQILKEVSLDLEWSVVDYNDHQTKELVFKSVKSSNSSVIDASVDEEFDDSLASGIIEDEDAVTAAPSDWYILEHRIGYSLSHEVPILYCRAWHGESGQHFSLDEMWNLFSHHTRTSTTSLPDEEMWKTLTSVEHPKTGAPCCVLHPCKTAQLMATVCLNGNYLIPWLSIFGQALGLSLPLDFYRTVCGK